MCGKFAVNTKCAALNVRFMEIMKGNSHSNYLINFSFLSN